MTPKEKSAELFEKYLTPNLVSPLYGVLSYSEAKECALIVCNEFIDAMTVTHIGYCKGAFNNYYKKKKEYWLEVRAEIEKL